MGGLEFGLTDAIDLDVDPRAQDLVPAEDRKDLAAAAVDGAEGVEEGGVGREVVFYSLLLETRRARCEFVDYCIDFLDGILHLVVGLRRSLQ